MMTSSGNDSSGPTVTFWGAAHAVTGSMHLVEAAGCKILLDCGLVRGHHGHLRALSHDFPFPPHMIDAVVLSHAHLDHCGNLSNLVRHGFAGPIYCTPATRDLLAVMLADSARIQEEEAFVRSVIGLDDEPDPAIAPRHGANQVVQQCVAVPYGQSQPISPDIQLRLANAGHILGSAMVSLTIAGDGADRSITFTGDLGRRGSPLLRAADPVPAADLLICESTHGGRQLPSRADAVAELEAIVVRTVERGGKVLIPAFSLGRTQLVVHYLHEGMHRGRLPRVPIYVDSPLAANLAEVYRQHPECLTESYASDETGVQYVRSHAESGELSNRRGPCIIVAPSGMCDGGRIVRHLKENLDDPRCSVVLVSYQAPQTLGRRLLHPAARIRIHGRDFNFWADVVEMPAFSGHADQAELLDYLRPLAGRARQVCLVHGERDQAETLADLLRGEGFAEVAAPARGDTVVVPAFTSASAGACPGTRMCPGR